MKKFIIEHKKKGQNMDDNNRGGTKKMDRTIRRTRVKSINEGKIKGKLGKRRPRQSYKKQIMWDIRKRSYRESNEFALDTEE